MTFIRNKLSITFHKFHFKLFSVDPIGLLKALDLHIYWSFESVGCTTFISLIICKNDYTDSRSVTKVKYLWSRSVIGRVCPSRNKVSIYTFIVYSSSIDVYFPLGCKNSLNGYSNNKLKVNIVKSNYIYLKLKYASSDDITIKFH